MCYSYKRSKLTSLIILLWSIICLFTGIIVLFETINGYYRLSGYIIGIASILWCIYSLVDFFKYKILLCDDFIEQIRLFNNKRIEYTAIDVVHVAGRIIILYSGKKRIKLYGNLANRKELINKLCDKFKSLHNIKFEGEEERICYYFNR